MCQQQKKDKTITNELQQSPSNLVIQYQQQQQGKTEPYIIRQKSLPNNLKVKVPKKFYRKQSQGDRHVQLNYTIDELQEPTQFIIKIRKASQSYSADKNVSDWMKDDMQSASDKVNEQQCVDHYNNDKQQPLVLDIDSILLSVIQLSQTMGANIVKKQSITNESDLHEIDFEHHERIVTN